MKYNLIISPGTFCQIEEAVTFVTKVSIVAAQDLYREIMSAIRSLEEFPFRFQKDNRYDVFVAEERKMVISKRRYSILYHINDDEVVVERFIDNRKK